MHKVILDAEDGEYVMFTGPEKECFKWMNEHESSYGEGQELYMVEIYEVFL
jgi:hypothetical protein